MKPNQLREMLSNTEPKVLCENCLFWVDRNGSYGDCRYHPPRTHILEQVKMIREVDDNRSPSPIERPEHWDEDRYVAVWPKTNRWDWCSFWEQSANVAQNVTQTEKVKEKLRV